MSSRYLDLMPELGYMPGDEDLLDDQDAQEEGTGRGNQEALVRGNRAGGNDALRSGRKVPVIMGAVRDNNGLCSVHVDVTRIGSLGVHENVNQRTVLDVEWSSGGFGGFCRVDADRGSQFTIGGADTVNIYASIESGVLDVNGVLEELVADVGYRVEATVHWGPSFNPKPAFFTLPSVRLNPVGPAPGAGPFQEIPRQARGMMVLCDVETAMATMVARFQRNGMVGVTTNRIHSQLNPNANGVPIVHGMEVVSLDAPGILCVATCMFDLWL